MLSSFDALSWFTIDNNVIYGSTVYVNSLVCSSALLDGKGCEDDPVEVGRAALSGSGSGLR